MTINAGLKLETGFYQPSATSLPTYKDSFLISTLQAPFNKCSDLHQYTLKKLEAADAALNDWMPPFAFQISYDRCLNDLHSFLESPDYGWNRFNSWLEKEHFDHFLPNLAMFLAKLPLKAARNIIRIVGSILKMTVQSITDFIVHPLKSAINLGRLIVQLIHALLQPETWTKVGIGILGSSLGNLTFLSNPLSLFSVLIGGVLIITGLSFGTLKTILFAEEGKRFNAAKDYLFEQCKKVPEDLLTSYLFSLLIHGIEKCVRGIQKLHQENKHAKAVDKVNKENSYTMGKIDQQNKLNLTNSAKDYTEAEMQKIIEKYNLPQPDRINNNMLDGSVRWNLDKMKASNVSFQDIPEGNLVVENLKVGEKIIKTEKIIPGYWDTKTVTSYVTDPKTGQSVLQTSYVKSYVPSRVQEVITKEPIYDKFIGYNIKASSESWVKPDVIPYPELTPLPQMPPLELTQFPMGVHQASTITANDELLNELNEQIKNNSKI